MLVGSGLAVGNAVLFGLGFAGLNLTDGTNALFTTSALMLTVGLLACLEPARRALRIQPTEALKEA